MRFHHKIIIDHSFVQPEFKISIVKFNKVEIHNLIGYSDIWIVHEGNKISCFKHMLFDVMLDLASNFISLSENKITNGMLFTMDPDWDYHFSYVFEEDFCYFNFKQFGKIALPISKFHFHISIFILEVFDSLESFYIDIEKNPYYLELKNELINFTNIDNYRKVNKYLWDNFNVGRV